MDACNYNLDATEDDGSCVFADENYDCDGNCTAVEDCAGECGGGAVVDECGVCDGDNSSCSDCAGVPNGDASEDNCGTCDSDSTNDCLQDCMGEWGGDAEEDEWVNGVVMQKKMNVLFVVVMDLWMDLIAMEIVLKIVNMIVLISFREPENLITVVPVLIAPNLRKIAHSTPPGISPVLIVQENLTEMHLSMGVESV